MNNIDCGINKENRIPYLSDSELWLDFASIMEFLLWAVLQKEEMERNGEDTAELLLHVNEELEEAEEIIQRRIELTKISGFELHTVKFFSLYHFAKIEKFALVLAGVVGMKDTLIPIFSAAETGKNVQTPTVEMALRLYGITIEQDFKETALLVNRTGDFASCLDSHSNSSKAWHQETLSLRKPLLAYLLGQPFVASYRKYAVQEPLPKLLVYEEVLEKAISVSKHQGTSAEPLVMYLYGRKKSGKKLLISYLAKYLQRPVTFLCWQDIFPMSEEKRDNLFQEIKLKTKLENGFLCLYDIPNWEEDQENTSYDSMFSRVLDVCPFTVVLGEGKHDFPVWITEKFVSFHLWDMTATEKIAVWSCFSRLYLAEDQIDATLNGNKYVMSVGEIENTFATAYLTSLSNGTSFEGKYVEEAVKQRGRGNLGNYATLINGKFIWDDLIVDPTVKRQMQYICAQVKYRNIVGEEWGFFEKTPYGRGISVLFYGPPGTGKTMAVQVIAAELGLELYRIDLSKMVSKYIGETEKNISSLFERAKQMNVILFFDEADSLFAKRSEVKDSNDRNANAETAHLLQKMEEYEGMVILATNLVDQIDDAFRRRIKFMIPFRFPDVETRKKLWHSLIPDKTPLEDGIDLDFFAETFELSGSQIKEILWNAAYIAVSDQKPLGNERLKEATMWNYMKYGKQLTKEDFGYLA